MNNTNRPMEMGPDGRIHLGAATSESPQARSDATAPTQPDQHAPDVAAAAPRAYPQQRAPLLSQAPTAANASENPFVAFQNHPAMADPAFLQSLLMSTLPLQGLNGANQGATVVGSGPQRSLPSLLPAAVSASVLSPAVYPPALFAAVQQQTGIPIPATNKLATPQEPSGELTRTAPHHREPTSLYLECDDQNLSSYQCLIRKQIEFFQASQQEIDGTAQGRNTPIVLGQVGIRCRHCAIHAPQHRRAGAVYFPRRLNGVYQTAQNMAAGHILKKCTHVPESDRKTILMLKKKSSAGGGRKYWSDAAGIMGIFETAQGLRFVPRKGSV